MMAALTGIPVIETGRLILREPREGDLPALARFAASPRSHFVGGPAGVEQAWRWLAGGIGHWVLRGFGMWTVEEQGTGRVAGRVGVLENFGWPEPELAWQVFDGFEGRGIAHEAALAARDAAARLFGLGPLISLIAPDNARSRRLAERLGATVEGPAEVLGTPCLVYRHPRAEAA